MVWSLLLGVLLAKALIAGIQVGQYQ